MKSSIYYLQVLILPLAVSFANSAHADKEDRQALKAAKVSLAQAATAAEDNLQGKAVKAEIDLKNDKPVFEVDVIKNDVSYEAIVDAETGKVISSKED